MSQKVNKSLKNNIALNCLKTFLSFVFPLITFPYISRVLGSVGIGKVNFSSSVISYFALIASLGVATYSVREGAAIRDDDNKRNAFFNEVFSVNFVSVLIAYILLVITVIINAKLQNYTLLLAIQSLSMLFTWLGVEWIFSIYEDYFQITMRAIGVQVVSLVLMFVFVKTEEDYVVYAMIMVLANAGSYIFNFFISKKYYRPHIIVHCNFRKHIMPMLVLAANSVAVTIYVNSDTTMIGLMLDERSVGLYSTGVKVYTIVKHVMAAVIASATPRVSYYFWNNKKTEYEQIIKNMACVLLIICVPAMVGLFMESYDIIMILAGSEFAQSVDVLRVLSFAILFATFGSFAATYGLIVERKEKEVFKYTAISAVINVCLNFVLIPVLGIIGAAFTTLVSELFVFIALMKKTNYFRIIGRLKHSISSCILGCIGIILVCLCSRVISVLYLRTIIAIGLSGSVYLIIIVLRKEELIINETKKIVMKIRVLEK